MATAKVSLTLDEALLNSARQRVGRRGLSHYVNEALRLQLQRDRLVSLLDELEREHGPLSPELMEEVREAWPDAAEDRRRSA
jgi:hypothetical protein